MQQGGGAGQYNNKVQIGWSDTGLRAYIDGWKDLGNFSFDNHTHDGLSLAVAAANNIYAAIHANDYTNGNVEKVLMNPITVYVHNLWDSGPWVDPNWANVQLGNQNIYIPAIGDIYIFAAWTNTTNLYLVSSTGFYTRSVRLCYGSSSKKPNNYSRCIEWKGCNWDTHTTIYNMHQCTKSDESGTPDVVANNFLIPAKCIVIKFSACV